ncbi:fused response regulator/phosphatase [Amycolatopsis rhabdoformis]|uniref:Fused response regulator/phosphatase n=1 Tax=Amycolatopsis rhabdoformis TaxID=1448059 RepID=A0ABZ1IEH7_9PSEU|nr:fused response regulator/phosphatase [Amycolatopsis rhabdoformis]WSE32093.1 fused response regulator/phosphatase [Amycolatopsis rhabdoformis]
MKPDNAAEHTQVLVVDDHEASRYLTGSWLRRNGYQVLEAATGAEALAVLGENDLDLVLLDVHLPDISGFEVCERVKRDPRTAALPVIHVSATAIEPGDRAEGLTRGADAYLVEPLDPGVLVATVEAALRYYRARASAERLADRLTRLTKATLAVIGATTFESLLKAASAGAANVLESPATVVALTPQGLLRADAGAGRPHLGIERTTLLDALSAELLGAGRVGSTTADGIALAWRGTEPSTVVLARGKPGRSPICLAVDASAITTDEDRNLLTQLAQATALAYEGMRTLSEEHTLALTLQHSLLPGSLPERPGVEMAVRYLPASDNAEIGGDFYDVIDLDGRLLIAVGDVSGHSIEAATIMGEVRHALRAYATEGHGPVAVLDHLDALIRRFHPRGLTTLCLLSLDPETGEAELASAGHIPPLLIEPGGSRYLDVAGPVLGIGLSRPPATRFTVPPGATVLLITDGLIERRGEVIDDSMANLLAFVEPDDDLDALCDRLLDRFGRDPEDDVALLALRRQ